jgi:hypothetical protein
MTPASRKRSGSPIATFSHEWCFTVSLQKISGTVSVVSDPLAAFGGVSPLLRGRVRFPKSRI